jgi:hypothetical protein
MMVRTGTTVCFRDEPEHHSSFCANGASRSKYSIMKGAFRSTAAAMSAICRHRRQGGRPIPCRHLVAVR